MIPYKKLCVEYERGWGRRVLELPFEWWDFVDEADVVHVSNEEDQLRNHDSNPTLSQQTKHCQSWIRVLTTSWISHQFPKIDRDTGIRVAEKEDPEVGDEHGAEEDGEEVDIVALPE